MKLQRRSAFGWGPSAAGYADPRLGIAVHYEGSRTGIANWTHDRCIDHWQATRRFHMNTRGWKDIAYSFSCCKHYVLEGRGPRKAQAAQPGGNTTWYSCTFMTGPGEAIHPGQVENFRQLRAWLRGTYGVAAAIRPHSSFVSTGCPGDILRRMIADGTLTRPPQSEEDDLPYTEAQLKRIINEATDDLINKTAYEVLRRLGPDGGSVAAAARREIANEILFRTRANLHLPDRETESVNLLTLGMRSVQHIAALADAVAAHVVEPDQPPVEEPEL
jgi:hypothetical protein